VYIALSEIDSPVRGTSQGRVMVVVRDRVPTPTMPSAISTLGPCSAYPNGGAVDTTGQVQIGADAVTISVDGGAEQAVPWSADGLAYGQTVNAFHSGSTARVRVQIPGGPTIDRTLTFAGVTVATPTPHVLGGEFAQYPFTAGQDLTVTWTPPSDATARVRAVVYPGLDPIPTLVLCDASASAGTLTMPWAILSMYGGLPGSSTMISQLDLELLHDTHETASGIDVELVTVSYSDGGLINW
jgi:hypothetical protein